GMHRALLVAHEHVLHLVLLEELVVDEQPRAARIAEDVFHRLFLQSANNDLGARKGAGLHSIHGRAKSLRSHDGNIARTTSPRRGRSEEHTSELQSRFDLVCRLLLEKKKKT